MHENKFVSDKAQNLRLLAIGHTTAQRNVEILWIKLQIKPEFGYDKSSYGHHQSRSVKRLLPVQRATCGKGNTSP
jgi:hypothetical protein